MCTNSLNRKAPPTFLQSTAAAALGDPGAYTARVASGFDPSARRYGATAELRYALLEVSEMTLSLTAFFLGALGGLGLPELVIVLALIVMVVVFVSRSIAGRNRPTRYCRSCGRGLMQPLDAPFCSYCGQRIG